MTDDLVFKSIRVVREDATVVIELACNNARLAEKFKDDMLAALREGGIELQLMLHPGERVPEGAQLQ